jgi:hypothetical protein
MLRLGLLLALLLLALMLGRALLRRQERDSQARSENNYSGSSFHIC